MEENMKVTDICSTTTPYVQAKGTQTKSASTTPAVKSANAKQHSYQQVIQLKQMQVIQLKQIQLLVQIQPVQHLR